MRRRVSGPIHCSKANAINWISRGIADPRPTGASRNGLANSTHMVRLAWDSVAASRRSTGVSAIHRGSFVRDLATTTHPRRDSSSSSLHAVNAAIHPHARKLDIFLSFTILFFPSSSPPPLEDTFAQPPCRKSREPCLRVGNVQDTGAVGRFEMHGEVILLGELTAPVFDQRDFAYPTTGYEPKAAACSIAIPSTIRARERARS